MPLSRSALSRDEIATGLTRLLGDAQVSTLDSALREASVDRFKKYTAALGIFDGPFPAAIVYPESVEQVSAVLAFADQNLVAVVPRTGGTATEGGLETVVPDAIVLDGSRLDRILDIDAENMMATVQCGVPLQRLEDELRVRGLTTGHSPQSKPLAQYGGLTATRSIGQFSTLYGGIEDMIVGLEAVLPDGTVTRIKNVPRRAAGPDIRHLVIGNEGALCYITEVTIKLFRYRPENSLFYGFLVDEFGDGIDALRSLFVDGYRPSVARVYSPEDAAQHFDFTHGKNVVILVAEGPKPIADATGQAIEAVFAARAHERVDPAMIEAWFGRLNWDRAAIDRERADMVARAHLGYTTEVSIDWSRVDDLYRSVMQRVRTEFPRAADLTMLGAHSSHSYQTGTNLYFVYDYWIRCEPRGELTEYHEPINAIIVEETLRLGGSMVHHHGIGKYRTRWTAQEHGSGLELLRRVKNALDPNGIMNPGTIFPLES